MTARAPLDAGLRQWLRHLPMPQTEIARAVGRSTGWVNKYIHGAGKATVDDLVRLLALVSGYAGTGLTPLEDRLLRAFRQVPVERQEDAVRVFDAFRRPRELKRARSERAERTPPATTNKSRDIRRGAGRAAQS